jgi:hypothetical protein
MNLSCPTESGTSRLSANCSTTDSNAGIAYYGLHWTRPTNWTQATFDDTSWPTATTYTNGTIGVDNKPAYTNFTNIFDDVSNDAQFIWSKNVILDNEVIVRKTVASLSINETEELNPKISIYPNPAKNQFNLDFDSTIDIDKIQIFNTLGEKVFETNTISKNITFGTIPSGMYFVKIISNTFGVTKKLMVE